ncbi:MAG: polysaccharide deacetylase family protein [Planctomycetota bacterium]
MTKPIASLSLDFDNKWAYLRAAGRERWESSTSYLPKVADRMVDLLGDIGLPLTVFVVGRDLREETDRRAVCSFQRLVDVEYANHSLNHLPWMHTMSDEEIFTEIETTHQAITDTTGQSPLGFRGPGFSCPDEVLRVLSALHYLYDASIFPTSLAPVARAVFLMRTKLKGEQREKAKKLYGGFASMLQPNRPHRREIDGASLWEVPVTVMPLTRTPIHFSYFTFLGSFSTFAAKTYFRAALNLCRITGTAPSILLHPPDFMGIEDDDDMKYLPGMKMSVEKKLSLVRWALRLLADRFEVHTMIGQLARLDDAISLPTRTVDTEPSSPEIALT